MNKINLCNELLHERTYDKTCSLITGNYLSEFTEDWQKDKVKDNLNIPKKYKTVHGQQITGEGDIRLGHYYEGDDFVRLGTGTTEEITINSKNIILLGTSTVNGEKIITKTDLSKYETKENSAAFAEYAENRYQQKSDIILTTPSNIQIGRGDQSIYILGNYGTTISIDENLQELIINSRNIKLNGDTYLNNIMLSTSAVIKIPSVDYVDLGLPSGTLWATCNVGAATPEECGEYFAWGENAPKSDYSWTNYTTHANGSYNSLIKYNTHSGYGQVDNKITLELSDDTAFRLNGKGWHIPTVTEITELFQTCSHETVPGPALDVPSYTRFTGPNGNSIILPHGGHKEGDTLVGFYEQMYYWVNTVRSDFPSRAIFFDKDGINNNGIGRSFGINIRPVYTPYSEQVLNPELLILINNAIKNLERRIAFLESRN